jgi:hypothetical protein
MTTSLAKVIFGVRSIGVSSTYDKVPFVLGLWIYEQSIFAHKERLLMTCAAHEEQAIQALRLVATKGN